jgi:hypothetical protein
VNCVRTVPALRELHRLYAGRGLVVVGVHSPEFDHERDPAAVEKAIAKLQIPYLVALDSDFALWKGFGNRSWPSTYLVDRDGSIVWRHVGELHRDTAAWKDAVAAIGGILEGP